MPDGPGIPVQPTLWDALAVEYSSDSSESAESWLSDELLFSTGGPVRFPRTKSGKKSTPRSQEVHVPIFALHDGEDLSEHLGQVLTVECRPNQLCVNMFAHFPDNGRVPLRVLIDTGSDVCLVKKDLFPRTNSKPPPLA